MPSVCLEITWLAFYWKCTKEYLYFKKNWKSEKMQEKVRFWKLYIKVREMLINALRAMVKNPYKESFYEKKKTINVLTAFFYFP